MDEDLAEEAKQNFLKATIQLLKQKSKGSQLPHSPEKAPVILPKDSLYLKQYQSKYFEILRMIGFIWQQILFLWPYL